MHLRGLGSRKPTHWVTHWMAYPLLQDTLSSTLDGTLDGMLFWHTFEKAKVYIFPGKMYTFTGMANNEPSSHQIWIKIWSSNSCPSKSIHFTRQNVYFWLWDSNFRLGILKFHPQIPKSIHFTSKNVYLWHVGPSEHSKRIHLARSNCVFRFSRGCQKMHTVWEVFLVAPKNGMPGLCCPRIWAPETVSIFLRPWTSWSSRNLRISAYISTWRSDLFTQQFW